MNEDELLQPPVEETSPKQKHGILRAFFGPFSAFWNIVKTFAGAGSFGLPWALQQGGLLAGTIGIILLALLADYTMQIIVKCRRYIQSQEEYEDSDYWKFRPLRSKGATRQPPVHQRDNTEYGVIDEETTPSESSQLTKKSVNEVSSDDYIYDTSRIFTFVDLAYETMGRAGSILVYIFFFSCNLGVGTVYLVAFSGLMTDMLPITANPEVSQRLWMLAMVPFFIPMSWNRNYKIMTPFSIIGTLSLILALGTVVGYGFTYQLEKMSVTWRTAPLINFPTLPLFFGVTAFLFNTHTMVLPIEQSLENRKAYPITLHLAFIFVAIMNLSFAIVGYLFFGSAVKDNIVGNIPNTSVFVYIIKATLCAELFMTYAIVIMPVSEVLDEQLFSKFKTTNKVKFYGFSGIMRSCIVLLTVGVAEIFGSNFGVVMGFIGGISPNALGFILPPLFYLILMRRQMGYFAFVFNCLIVVFGVVAMITCTWVSIMGLIK